MKSFNLLSIFSAFILAFIVKETLAGQYCSLEIINSTNHTLKLFKIEKYQMNKWSFDNEIENNKTGFGEIQPSSWIFYDLRKNGGNAYYNLTDTNDYLSIKFSKNQVMSFESNQSADFFNYPIDKLFQKCTLKLFFDVKNGNYSISSQKIIKWSV